MTLRLNSGAVVVDESVKFQIHTIIQTLDFAASRRYGKADFRILKRLPSLRTQLITFTTQPNINWIWHRTRRLSIWGRDWKLNLQNGWAMWCLYIVSRMVLNSTVVLQDSPRCHCKCSLQWRHNGRDSVSNHQSHDCLLNRLFRCRSRKTSKLRPTGLCAGNSPGTGEFPAQIASYAENVSIWWRHHDYVTHNAKSTALLVIICLDALWQKINEQQHKTSHVFVLCCILWFFSFLYKSSLPSFRQQGPLYCHWLQSCDCPQLVRNTKILSGWTPRIHSELLLTPK